ncbi:metal-binding protein [Sphingomonas metalli]|uniref:Metal-binding protein n=1 Tax=Sphingomonas metalli TaxID=1779358 RepID=A0A916WQ39_9SPHN|nr:DUF177 domain-containing protein [Sphingomonas metalli]GGB23812.1 metal-binding protein [Sphingomonas metalli]
MTTPEWSRPERLDTIGEGERTVTISADEEERRALARRFDLPGIERLEASFALRREAAGIAATGRVTAELRQACSVTGEPLTTRIDEPVALRFVEPATGGDEVELSADALDTIEIEGGAIDLGEAAAETMALAIDPFVRGPNAASALARAGVLTEDQTGPFAALAALKREQGGAG